MKTKKQTLKRNKLATQPQQPTELEIPQPEMFESPESSQVAGASYYPITKVLIIIFKGQPDPAMGAMYEYRNFPESVWQQFKQAPSKGQFVNSTIVGDRKNPNYKGVKVA